MDTKLEIQRLRHRVQELEQENAELRARLAAFDASSPAQGKDNGATSSKTQRPANTASASNTGASATDLPASARNAPSAPLCRADTASVTRASPPAEKIRLFRSLFRGRGDVYALRWHSEKTQGTTVPHRMEEIRQYILAHYTENDLTAASVAATFQMSGSYLSRAFKDSTGTNILDYIQRLRVDAAKELLRTESVKNTAQKVGFWDTQGLVRAFKKHEGMTPSEFKRVHEDDM